MTSVRVILVLCICSKLAFALALLSTKSDIIMEVQDLAGSDSDYRSIRESGVWGGGGGGGFFLGEESTLLVNIIITGTLFFPV